MNKRLPGGPADSASSRLVSPRFVRFLRLLPPGTSMFRLQPEVLLAEAHCTQETGPVSSAFVLIGITRGLNMEPGRPKLLSVCGYMDKKSLPGWR